MVQMGNIGLLLPLANNDDQQNSDFLTSTYANSYGRNMKSGYFWHGILDLPFRFIYISTLSCHF
ncbi:hypothetical protein C0081_21755 [Cohaesibacter celericrescens]|uniref:Uncharacterized protein n=1 Tax=Cohaesibacter celericrescens TaxID=2067669 RepID=A0A2N5XKC5_9HYPH|nr:hypothetical protein C0081_21755 [Cohaesibacter celericrescens]